MVYADTATPVLHGANCSLVDAQKLRAFKGTLHDGVQRACIHKAHKNSVSFEGCLQQATALELVGN